MELYRSKNGISLALLSVLLPVCSQFNCSLFCIMIVHHKGLDRSDTRVTSQISLGCYTQAGYSVFIDSDQTRAVKYVNY